MEKEPKQKLDKFNEVMLELANADMSKAKDNIKLKPIMDENSENLINVLKVLELAVQEGFICEEGLENIIDTKVLWLTSISILKETHREWYTVFSLALKIVNNYFFARKDESTKQRLI